MSIFLIICLSMFLLIVIFLFIVHEKLLGSNINKRKVFLEMFKRLSSCACNTFIFVYSNQKRVETFQFYYIIYRFSFEGVFANFMCLHLNAWRFRNFSRENKQSSRRRKQIQNLFDKTFSILKNLSLSFSAYVNFSIKFVSMRRGRAAGSSSRARLFQDKKLHMGESMGAKRQEMCSCRRRGRVGGVRRVLHFSDDGVEQEVGGGWLWGGREVARNWPVREIRVFLFSTQFPGSTSYSLTIKRQRRPTRSNYTPDAKFSTQIINTTPNFWFY